MWRGGGGDSPSPWEDAQCFVPDRSDDCAAMTFLIDSCDENLCLTWENNESGEETSTRGCVRNGGTRHRVGHCNSVHLLWYGVVENAIPGGMRGLVLASLSAACQALCSGSLCYRNQRLMGRVPGKSDATARLGIPRCAPCRWLKVGRTFGWSGRRRPHWPNGTRHGLNRSRTSPRTSERIGFHPYFPSQGTGRGAGAGGTRELWVQRAGHTLEMIDLGILPLLSTGPSDPRHVRTLAYQMFCLKVSRQLLV